MLTNIENNSILDLFKTLGFNIFGEVSKDISRYIAYLASPVLLHLGKVASLDRSLVLTRKNFGLELEDVELHVFPDVEERRVLLDIVTPLEIYSTSFAKTLAKVLSAMLLAQSEPEYTRLDFDNEFDIAMLREATRPLILPRSLLQHIQQIDDNYVRTLRTLCEIARDYIKVLRDAGETAIAPIRYVKYSEDKITYILPDYLEQDNVSQLVTMFRKAIDVPAQVITIQTGGNHDLVILPESKSKNIIILSSLETLTRPPVSSLEPILGNFITILVIKHNLPNNIIDKVRRAISKGVQRGATSLKKLIYSILETYKDNINLIEFREIIKKKFHEGFLRDVISKYVR